MKKFIVYGIVLFSFIFNIVFIIHLVSMRNPDGEDISLFGKDVKLTAAQERDIRLKCNPIGNDNLKFEKELKLKRVKLLTLVKNRNIDMKKIESCIDEINSIQKKIQLNVVRQMIIYKNHMNMEQCSCFMNDLGKEMGVGHICDDNCGCSPK